MLVEMTLLDDCSNELTSGSYHLFKVSLIRLPSFLSVTADDVFATGQLRSALLNLVSLPSLTAPASVLSLLTDTSSSKPASSLSSISTETLLSTSHTFSRLASLVPLEYLGREYRAQLAERALSLDLWISAGGVQLQAQEQEVAQTEMRRFVGYMGSVVVRSFLILCSSVQR